MPAIADAYPEEIIAVREGITTFVKRVVIPTHERYVGVLDNSRRRYDSDGRTSSEASKIIATLRQQSAEAGYYTMCVPAELGGGGMGYLAYFAAWERLFHLCGSKYWLALYVIAHWGRGPSAVLSKFRSGMRDVLMPDLMAGRTTLCFALSEPGAGSDATMIKTRATPDGEGWRLNGSKIWITNAPNADHAIVFAVTSPELAEQRRGGISAFVVPTSSPGFELEGLIKMWGSSGTDEGQLRFDNVRIEPDQLLGEVDEGFGIAMLGVGLGRIYNSARAVGTGRWALEQGIEYAKVRHTFGQPLSEHQGISFQLAESAMELHAAHLVAINAAKLLDSGARATKEVSMAKAMAVEAGRATVDRVMQVHGAMGFTNELHLTSAYIAMRKVGIADGPNEILRRQIAKSLFEGDIDL